MVLGTPSAGHVREVKSDTADSSVCFQVWIWSKAKFINRKFLMEELYQRFLEGEASHVAREDDPFWDPVEAVHLGSAHVWLQPLAYCMRLEEQVEFLNCDGTEEAVLHVHVTPCSPGGQWVSPSSLVLGVPSRGLTACLSSPGRWSARCPEELTQPRLGQAKSNWIFAMAVKSADLEFSRVW